MKRGRPCKNKEADPIDETDLEIIERDTEEKKDISVPQKPTKEQEERLAKVKTIMRDMNKEYNNPNFCKFACDEPPKESIPFGHKDLDNFFGGGGAVYGNYVVFWGTEGVGKTTLALMEIVEAQKQNKVCVYVDMEHTLDKERMSLFGVNLDTLILEEQCENAEQAMDTVIRWAGTADLIVIDSIQAMSPKEEQVSGKGEKIRAMEEAEIAALAKKMGKFLRRTSHLVYKGHTAIFLIGQARTGGIGTFITRDELTGGRAIKFWSLLTVYMRKGQGADAPTEKIEIDELDEKGKPKFDKVKCGFDCVMRIDKQKKFGCSPELSEIHLPYYFSKGFKYD